MPALRNLRHEAFAQAKATGLSDAAADRAVGYSRGRGWRLVRQDNVAARIVELTEEAKWGGIRDLGPLIRTLLRLATLAEKDETLQGLMATRSMLAEAGRLKRQLLRKPPAPPVIQAPPLPPAMTMEEWLASLPPPG